MFFGEEDELGAVRLAFGQSYNQRVLNTPGLLSYLPGTDTSGVTMVEAKNGYNWGYTNGPILNQLPGPGDGLPWVLFDGIDDGADPTVGTLAALNAPGAFNPDEFTFGLWAQITNPTLWNTGDLYCLFEIGADVDNRYLIYKPANPNILRFLATAGGGNQVSLDMAGVSVATPFSIFGTLSRSANKSRLFVNGVQQGADGTFGGAAWAGALVVGWTQLFSLFSAVVWPGLGGRAQIYNRALTPAEIAARSVMP